MTMTNYMRMQFTDMLSYVYDRQSPIVNVISCYFNARALPNVQFFQGLWWKAEFNAADLNKPQRTMGKYFY